MKVSDLIIAAVRSSDVTKHTKTEIDCYTFDIVSKLPSTVKTLKIWTDGPNNQFKNKFIAALIKVFEQRFNLKIYWNFFATSHGKGCVDGFGATVKNRVKRIVKSGKFTVNCSNDFTEAFNSESSVIDLKDFPELKMEKISEILNLNQIFAQAKPVRDIFNYHQIQVVGDNIVGFNISSKGYE